MKKKMAQLCALTFVIDYPVKVELLLKYMNN